MTRLALSAIRDIVLFLQREAGNTTFIMVFTFVLDFVLEFEYVYVELYKALIVWSNIL